MQNRQWRKKPNEDLIRLMEDSVDLKLYLVQEKGPLSLIFQDESGKKFHIIIGNEISCSCGGGKTEHCPHTLFTLNRIFKIAFNNPLILQIKFTDSELDKLIENRKKKKQPKKENHQKSNSNNQMQLPINNSNQMSLLEDNVCPICQEDLYSIEGLYYCANSCGHNFHVGCVKIFIKHKKENDGLITCPMCRGKWDENEFSKTIASISTLKCTKSHKGINCSNCSRVNIKFERFHCLICENYNLCRECFGSFIHRDKNHSFIMKKSVEDKWVGCDYREVFDNYYTIKNIYLTQYLTSLLPNYKKEEEENNDLNDEHEQNEVHNNNNNANNQNELRRQINVNENKCAVCKAVTKQYSHQNEAKTIHFLMLKSLPCKHVIHIKCCEKAFKLEQTSKGIVVDKAFNKCRIDNCNIFKGLASIRVIYTSSTVVEEKGRSVSSNGIYAINLSHPQARKGKSLNKKQLIQKILMEKNTDDYQYNSQSFGLNIQKVNFNHENDIQKFELNVMNRNIFNEKIRKKGILAKIPYRQIHSRVKKVDPIIAKDKDTTTKGKEDIQRELKVQKLPLMNNRPIRYENEHKVQLSPLLIDLP